MERNQMCQTLLPHITPTARIVNLSSIASQLKLYSPEIQTRLLTARSLSQLEDLAAEFETAVQAKKEVEAGFARPGLSYSFSKALLRAATSILAREHREANPESKVLINCCCPGWVKTDMGHIVGKPPKTPEEGALIPVKLAFEDIEGVTGEYWANDSVRSRESGRVQKWEDTMS